MSTEKSPEQIAEERYPHEKIDSPTMRVHRQFMRNGYAACYREHVLPRQSVALSEEEIERIAKGWQQKQMPSGWNDEEITWRLHAKSVLRYYRDHIPASPPSNSRRDLGGGKGVSGKQRGDRHA